MPLLPSSSINIGGDHDRQLVDLLIGVDHSQQMMGAGGGGGHLHQLQLQTHHQYNIG
jgi:hypothetical protein